jgi:predicted nucleotidyltransferase
MINVKDMSEYELKLLKELKSLLIMEYPETIDRLILFGSHVNQTARTYSDWDIILIVKQPYDWHFENEIYDLCVDINLKYDIIIDIKIISLEELDSLRGKQPFVQNALKHGVIL